MSWDLAIRTAATIAVLGTAVVYGTDTFCAIVLRPALARIDDDAMVAATGYTHLFGDRRMPLPGAVGIIATIASAGAAVLTGHWAQVAAAGVALAALSIWLLIYTRFSAPINRQLTQAAETGRTPSNARALQTKWDSVINLRALLQGVALAALCGVLAL